MWIWIAISGLSLILLIAIIELISIIRQKNEIQEYITYCEETLEMLENKQDQMEKFVNRQITPAIQKNMKNMQELKSKLNQLKSDDT